MDGMEFCDVLRQHASGRAETELTEALREVVAEVAKTGKPGKVTLELSVKPNQAGSVFLTTAVKAKAPDAGGAADVFFYDSERGFALSRRDPRQLTLEGLREVEDRSR